MSFKKYVLWMKEFFWKTNYDFDRADADLFNFHPQILVVLLMLGVTRKRSYATFVWPFLCVALNLVGVGFEIMFVIHGVEVDISFAIECFCYLLMLGVIPFLYGGVVPKNDEIIHMLDNMNADFRQVCSLGPKYRKLFMKRQLIIWMLCISWLLTTGLTGLMFMLFPVVLLTYQSLFATQDEYTTRPLSFPLWLPEDDPYRTPNYEVFLFIQMCLSFVYVQGFCGYVYLLFHFLIHYLTMMDMIILDFQVIFDGLDPTVASLPKHHPRRVDVQRILQKRVGRIVTWHQSVFKAISTVSSLFGPPLVYQVMFSSLALCFIFFQIAKTLEEGGFDVMFVMLAVCGTVQLWLPCYLGTLLRNKGFEIGDSCFNCGWNETPLGQMIRNDILLIIFRSQIPIYIKFTGLPNIQLETFSSVMSTSYSYFNMLRQYSS